MALDERYPNREEILRYLNFCADKRSERNIHLNQRWNGDLDETAACWNIICDTGLKLRPDT